MAGDNPKIRIMFVCMGNICRSPTAHGVMQQLLREHDLTEVIEVESSGTHAYHVGEKSDSRSRQLARSKGVDMEFIRAQKISITDYDNFDYILAMDEGNLELVQYYAPTKHNAKTGLFLDFARNVGKTDQTSVPDPYYGGSSGFKDVFQLVELGCEALLQYIQSNDLDGHDRKFINNYKSDL